MNTSLKSTSRLKTALMSSAVSFVSQLVIFALKFATRGFVLQVLGLQLLGLNQTFVNIMLIFSFTELGFIQSLDFLLYQSLARHEHGKTKSLYLLYKKIYAGMAVLVAVVGLILAPILPLFLQEQDRQIPNLFWIWGIFVATSSVTYLLRGKRPILEADQRQYIVAGVQAVGNILMLSLQIASLFVFKSFIIYLLINLVCQAGENFALMVISNRLYHVLDNETAVPLTPVELSQIKKVAVGGLIQHLSTAASTAIGSAALASVNSVDANGLLGNYVLIISGVSLLFQKIFTPMLPAIGQANALSDRHQQLELFRKYLFFTFLVALLVVPGTLVCINPLISLWLGSQYHINFIVVITLVVNLTIAILLNPVTLFQISFGIQWELRKMWIVQLIINLVVLSSGLYVFEFGILSVPLATLISQIFTSCWFVAHIEFRNHFKESFAIFIKDVALYSISLILVSGAAFLVTSTLFADDSPLSNLLLCALSSVALSTMFALLFFGKSKRVAALKAMVKR